MERENVNPDVMDTDLGKKDVLAKNLKRLMEANNISRYDLAKELDVNYSSISDWLNGYYYPRMDTIGRIADVFKVDKAALIEDIDRHPEKFLESISRKVRIPVLGSIPAGVPFEMISNEDAIDSEEIPAEWLKGGKEYFALKLSGDSMMTEYNDGDVVVFLKTPECSASGQDCCVRIGMDEATFKRVSYTQDGLKLTPLNKKNSSGFKEHTYTWDEVQNIPIAILGTVKKHVRYFK